MSAKPRIIEVRQRVLKQNDVVARGLRERFADAGVYVVSLVSSPGAGKTAFLEKTLTLLRDRCRVAALVGDLATDNDARRLARSGARVQQIITGTVCHLEAEMVRAAVEDWLLRGLDFLFIENVGNLVCPSSFDLGENLRLVLFSVTEGEDKPLKYPTIFNTSDAAVLTKNGPGGGRRVRRRGGAPQHPGGAAGDAGLRDVRQDGGGHGGVAGLPASAAGCRCPLGERRGVSPPVALHRRADAAPLALI